MGDDDEPGDPHPPARVSVEDAALADRTFDMLMGRAFPPHTRFIQTHATACATWTFELVVEVKFQPPGMVGVCFFRVERAVLC